MDRRRFLGTAAGVGLGISAGCLSDDDETYATLQSLNLVNSHDTTISVDMRIERADTDEVVHAETRELTLDPAVRIVDCVWPDAPVTLRVRHVDGEWERFETTDRDGCVGVIADVRNRDVGFYVHNSSCPIRSPDCHTAVGE